jgi:glycosyltransferase involved in cell wall biosynthesis
VFGSSDYALCAAWNALYIRDTLSRMKLSVMMVTYNHERFIAQALESVLAQRVNFDYEIVIGEDCSMDGTRAILMDFHRCYPGRIVPLLREQNQGAIPNFEATIAACRGQYVALLEGDDYWTCEDKLQRQIDFLDAHPDFAICCHRVQILNEMGTNQAGVFPPRSAGSYTLEDLLKGNFIMTCTVVYRRASVAALPSWFRQMKLGDWPLMALAAQSGKINLMDEVMAIYRVHSGGLWSGRSLAGQLRESIPMLEALDEELGFRYTSTISRTIAQYHLDLAILARADGSRRGAAKHLVNCIRSGGWQLPSSSRTLAGLAAYAFIGSRYRVFSSAKQANPS